MDKSRTVEWIARIAVGFVLMVNLQCALGFIVDPDAYVSGFELSGVSGIAALRGLGIAFLMWNVTYPLVIFKPRQNMRMFGVVLAQQFIGLVGETCLLLTLPTGHGTLAAGLKGFISFDALGLVLMGAAFVALLVVGRARN